MYEQEGNKIKLLQQMWSNTEKVSATTENI